MVKSCNQIFGGGSLQLFFSLLFVFFCFGKTKKNCYQKKKYIVMPWE
jgi:hypothetical protein